MPEKSIIQNSETESVRQVILLNERNNQTRFEHIENHLEKLSLTSNKIAENVSKLTVGLAEYKQVTERIFENINDHKTAIKLLQDELNLLKLGASGNKIWISALTSAVKMIISGFIGGALMAWWFIAKNGGG